MGTKAKDLKRDDHKREELGWDAAVTLVTPLPWHRKPIRWMVLTSLGRGWLIRLLRLLGLTEMRPVDDQLRRLNHLHYARWSIVRRLPQVEGSARERGRHTLLLFTSHFDFGWRRYLGTFIETTGDGLANLWGDTPSWRFPSDGYRRFENFVVDQQVQHGHLYAAFPELSCNDVRAVLKIRQEFEAADLAGLGRSGAEPARQRALLRRLQHCLGHPPSSAILASNHAEPAPVAGSLAAGPSQSITCLVPYPHGRQDKLDTALEELYVGPDSPFAAVAGTHFARISSIGKRYFVPRSVPPFANGYLLVSAEIDRPVDEWLVDLSAAKALEPVWGICHGWAGSSSLPDLLRQCRIRPTLEFIDYPGVSVAMIKDALNHAHKLNRLVGELAATR